MLSKTLRTLGVVVVGTCTVGFLAACTQDSSTEEVGSGSQGYVELTRDPTGIDLPSGGLTTGGTTGTKGERSAPVVSECGPRVIIDATFNPPTDQKEPALLGNSRIVKLDVDNTVPCIWPHDNEYPVRRCKVDIEKVTTHYSKATNTRYLRAGDAIGIEPGAPAEYIAATPVTKKTTFNKLTGQYETRNFVTCADPTNFDVAGTATGYELAGACAVETFNLGTNASGLPMDNYATRKVCSKTPATSDTTASATYMGLDASGASCYIGDGAGLNDANGTERNSSNVYLTGTNRCHVAWSGGYEVYAAKRPSTKNFPYPGVVDSSSAVWWRPVTTVPVAN